MEKHFFEIYFKDAKYQDIVYTFVLFPILPL